MFIFIETTFIKVVSIIRMARVNAKVNDFLYYLFLFVKGIYTGRKFLVQCADKRGYAYKIQAINFAF